MTSSVTPNSDSDGSAGSSTVTGRGGSASDLGFYISSKTQVSHGHPWLQALLTTYVNLSWTNGNIQNFSLDRDHWQYRKHFGAPDFLNYTAMADWRITAIICNTGFQVEVRVVWTNVRFTWIRPEVDLEYHINPFTGISATCLYQHPLQVQTFCDIPTSISWSSRQSRPSSTLSLVFYSSPSLPPLLNREMMSIRTPMVTVLVLQKV